MQTTRRTFLSAAGAAGLTAAYVDSASAKIEPEPWGIKLGIATYTYRKFERAKAIEFIKAVQTPWISIKADQPPRAGANQHLPGLPPEGRPLAADAVSQVRAARAEYEAAGIKVMSSGNVGMTRAKSVEDLRPTFEWAKAAGLPMMVCAPTHENMQFVEALVKEYDIRIAIHNHGPEDHNFPTPQSVLDVVRKLDSRCGLCMDVGHSVRAGADILKTIAEAGPRLFDMHVKDLSASLDSCVSVYARPGRDVLDYLNRISLFNSRAEYPTNWDLNVHLCADPMAAILKDKPGDIVVFTGKNRGKIDRILSAIEAGLHVLADKPWIVASSDMPKLEYALELAERKNVAAYDIMTERYEVTSQLQREFVSDTAVFGVLERGSAAEPAVQARSVHNLMKVVAGVPLRRPAWFFDIAEYGEGLADVGVHVVDLVQWTTFPGQPIDYRSEIEVIEGHRWPLTLSPEQFVQVTGEKRDAPLDYYCNNSVYYTLRGVHIKLEIVWQWQAEPGAGDVYEAAFRGSRARIEIRHGVAEKHIPQLYIVAAAGFRDQVFAAVRNLVTTLQSRWPGLAAVESGEALRIAIPEQFRVGHEAHFGQVANRFFEYAESPQSLPAWERPNMLAKYYVSTKGVELGVTGDR